MYSPALSRFIQEDPLGFDAGDENLYRFVGNDPVSYTDPTGLTKGFFGHVEAVLKTLGAMGIVDTQVAKRAIWDFANEAFKFSQEMVDKYRKCPGVDPERLESAKTRMASAFSRPLDRRDKLTANALFKSL